MPAYSNDANTQPSCYSLVMIAKPKETSLAWKVVDVCMRPLMYAGAGTIKERAQETHRWHIQNLEHELVHKIDATQTISVASTDMSIRMPGYALFHLPLFGGWRDYIVLKANTTEPWHIGWYTEKDGHIIRFDLHKLTLQNESVRLLKGLQDRTTTFFAVNQDGVQIALTEIGHGRIGDMSEFQSVRLL